MPASLTKDPARALRRAPENNGAGSKARGRRQANMAMAAIARRRKEAGQIAVFGSTQFIHSFIHSFRWPVELSGANKVVDDSNAAAVTKHYC